MEAKTSTSEAYAVVPAPGYHGDWVTVYATFTDEAKAIAYARRGGCRVLKGCDHAKGERIGRGVVQTMIDAGWWVAV